MFSDFPVARSSTAWLGVLLHAGDLIDAVFQHVGKLPPTAAESALPPAEPLDVLPIRIRLRQRVIGRGCCRAVDHDCRAFCIQARIRRLELNMDLVVSITVTLAS